MQNMTKRTIISVVLIAGALAFIAYELFTIRPILHDSLQTKLEQGSKEVGFHIFYPAWIPSGLELEKTGIHWTAENHLVSYTLGSFDEGRPWISVAQKTHTLDEKNTFVGRIDSLKEKREFIINDIKGYGGVTGEPEQSFNHLFFTTQDGTAIWIRAKDFDLDTLAHVARSMQ